MNSVERTNQIAREFDESEKEAQRRLGKDSGLRQELKALRAENERHRWIPVSERLPEDTDDVFVCSTKVKTLRKIGIGFYSIQCKKWIWFNRSRDVPTHWKPMILPEQALSEQK